jgi:hypothetical protein
MPGRLVNSQGRKYWLPFHCAISSLLLLPLRTAVVELRYRLSGCWVWEFRRSCARGGSVDRRGGGGGGCGGSSEGTKEDLVVKSENLIGCCNMLAFCETE